MKGCPTPLLFFVLTEMTSEVVWSSTGCLRRSKKGVLGGWKGRERVYPERRKTEDHVGATGRTRKVETGSPDEFWDGGVGYSKGVRGWWIRGTECG